VRKEGLRQEREGLMERERRGWRGKEREFRLFILFALLMRMEGEAEGSRVEGIGRGGREGRRKGREGKEAMEPDLINSYSTLQSLVLDDVCHTYPGREEGRVRQRVEGQEGEGQLEGEGGGRRANSVFSSASLL
jgi:hypothetical protein